MPDPRRFAYVIVVSVVLLVIGRWFFKRNAPLLIDSL